MRVLGGNPTQAVLQEMINGDGSGKIEFKEFLELFDRGWRPRYRRGFK